MIAIGIVSNLDDPEELGRLRAVLPSLGGIETGWLGVVTTGAGNGKGFVALPDVEDQVLVLFAREDLTQGVVLGSLFGAKRSPDWGLEDGQVRRYTLQTPGGQKIVLDDSGTRIRLENRAGSYLEMTPEKVLLHAMTGLEIRAPGNPIVIRGGSVDFRRA